MLVSKEGVGKVRTVSYRLFGPMQSQTAAREHARGEAFMSAPPGPSAGRLLPDPSQLRLLSLEADTHLTTVHAATTVPRARCLLCGHAWEQVHSRYVRQVADLPWHPWQGRILELELRARRFFCAARTRKE